MASDVAPPPAPLAIASLVCVIVGPVFSLLAWAMNLGAAMLGGAIPVALGLVLGHVAVLQIRKSEGALGGIYFAGAAIVAGYALLLAGALLGGAFYLVVRSIGD